MHNTTKHPVARITARRNPAAGEHGVAHQVNAKRMDVESHITGYGAHKRCLVSLHRASNTVTVRADHVQGQEHLPWPDQQQVLAAARHPWQRMHPKGTKLALASVSDVETKSQVPGILASRFWTFNVVTVRRQVH